MQFSAILRANCGNTYSIYTAQINFILSAIKVILYRGECQPVDLLCLHWQVNLNREKCNEETPRDVYFEQWHFGTDTFLFSGINNSSKKNG